MAKKKKRKKKGKGARGTQTRLDNKSNLVQQGLSSFNRGEYPTSIRYWQQAVSLSPDARLPEMLAEAYFRHALSLYPEDAYNLQARAGRQIISELHQAIQNNPNQPIYLYHLGLAYHRKGNLDKAVSWYRKALDAEPLNQRFQYHLAIAYMETGNFAESLEVFESLKGPVGKYSAVLSLLKQAKYSDIIEMLADDNSGYGAFFRGLACIANHNGKQAKAELRKAISSEHRSKETMLVDESLAQYYLGIAYAMSGNMFSAVKTWETACKNERIKTLMEPDMMDVYRELAASYVQKDALDKAIKIWESMLKLQPENEVAKKNLVRAYFLAGNEFAQQDNLRRAIAKWKRVAELDPKNADVLHNLALAYDKQNDPDTASQYWSQVISLWKQKLRSARSDTLEDKDTLKKRLNVAHKHLADNYLKIGWLDKAVGEYRNATYCVPDDVDALVELGKLYLYRNRFAGAVREFQKALRHKPDDVDILNHLAFANMLNDKPEKAIECWKKVLEIEPQNAPALEQITACCKERAAEYWYTDRKKALEWLQKAIGANPTDPSIHIFIGGVHLVDGEMELAAEAFSKAVKIVPTAPETYIGIGCQYLEEFHQDKAEEYFQKALTIDTINPMLAMPIASSYCDREDFDTAIKYFDIAIERAPTEPEVYYSIAAILFENDEYQLAQQYIKRGLTTTPDMPEMHMFLAQSYINNAQFDKARKELNQALKLAKEQKKGELIDIIQQMLEIIDYSPFGSFWDDF